MTYTNTASCGRKKKYRITSKFRFIASIIIMTGLITAVFGAVSAEMIDPKQQLMRITGNCIGCGHCVSVCPHGAVRIEADKGIVIDREKCDVCLKCADGCYAKALKAVAESMTVDEIMDVVEQDRGFYDNTGGGMTLSGGEVLMHGEVAAATTLSSPA